LANAAGISLSALAAAATLVALGFDDVVSWPLVATCVVVAVAADWLANSLIVGIASAVRSGDEIRASIRSQWVSDGDVSMFAVAVGAATALGNRDLVSETLCVCVALAAFEIRLKRRRNIDAAPTQSSERYLNASLIGIAALLVWNQPGLGALGCAFLAV